jgi:hypothetical protein
MAPAREPPVRTPASGVDLEATLPGAVVLSTRKVQDTHLFRALWKAHRARALTDGDYALAGAASALIDASDRLAPGDIVAHQVAKAGVDLAVFVDSKRGAVLAVAAPSHVFLSGF